MDSASNTLVSLIVPCYGVEKYLHRCIESAVSQTHDNIEIILIDDGSLDKSGDIAEEFAKKDKRIIVIHKKNGGVSSARNAGIDAAAGDYLCFADGDDWLEPDYIEYLLGLAVSTRSDIALSDRVHVAKRIIRDNPNKDDYNGDVEVVTASECIKRQFYYKIRTVAVFNKLYKASLFKHGIRFNSNFFMGEGFNFNIKIYQKASKIAIGHKRVYWYFKENTESATSKFSMRHIENGLLSIEDMGEVIASSSKDVKRAWRYAKYHTVCDFYAGMVKNNKSREFPVQYKMMSRYCRRYLFDALRSPVGLKEKLRPLVFAIIPGIWVTKIVSSKMIYRLYSRNWSV